MALLSLLPLRCAAAGMQRVVLVISESSQPYLDFVTAYGNRLAVGAPDAVLQVMDLAQFRQQPPERADLLVSAGSPAAELLADQSRSPLLMSLITRASHARLGGNKAGGVLLQSADISIGVLRGGAMPAAQYPQHYTIGVNERVARSLGLNLDDEAAIRARLEKLERQP